MTCTVPKFSGKRCIPLHVRFRYDLFVVCSRERDKYLKRLVPGLLASVAVLASGCGNKDAVQAKNVSVAAPQTVSVGVVRAESRPLANYLTVSAELVPFQEIDVYAKEAGYIRTLNVDYGSRVRKGQVMAVL